MLVPTQIRLLDALCPHRSSSVIIFEILEPLPTFLPGELSFPMSPLRAYYRK